MRQLFNKHSHLNRYKVSHGLSVTDTQGEACSYLAERKLKKIVNERLTEDIYLFFKRQKGYSPEWLASFDRFKDKILQHIENDKRVADKLKLFYDTDLTTVIDKYLNKRKKKK